MDVVEKQHEQTYGILPTEPVTAFHPRGASLAALMVTVFLVGVICLGQSGMKLLWYDELITLHTASLPTLVSIFHFFESGKDTTSFLPAMLVHVFQRLPGPIEITTRLPFMLGYLVACVCLWIFASRRYGAGYGTAAVLLFAQGWTLYFASEERAYALVLAATAVALLCWQSATGPTRHGGLWTTGVFLSLSTAVLFHFFAIFLLPAFLAAEVYLYKRSGKLRWGMLAAVLLYPVSLVLMLPNMIAARHIYGGTFWSKPTIGLLTDNYSVFLDPVAHNFAELLLVIAIAFQAGRRALRAAGKLTDSRAPGFSRPEWALLIAVALVPYIAFFGAQKLGVYRTQYVLYFQLAAMLIVIGALAETMRQHARVGWVLAVVMLFTLLIHDRDRFKQGLRLLAGKPVSLRNPSEYQGDLVDFLKQDHGLPLVVGGSDSLLVLDHYAPALRGKLILLTSHARAAEEDHAMTNELNMEVFGKDLQLPVQDFDSFTATHPDFLLIVNPEQIGFDWLFRSIVQHEVRNGRATVQLVWISRREAGDNVYRVHIAPPIS